MNTLGKIITGLLLACLLFATYLTTGALKARSSWLKKIGDKTTQIEQAEKDLASNKKLFLLLLAFVISQSQKIYS